MAKRKFQLTDEENLATEQAEWQTRDDLAAILFSGHVGVPTIRSGRASEYYLTVD